jgi:phospholipase/lecithinase/hemolysin
MDNLPKALTEQDRWYLKMLGDTPEQHAAHRALAWIDAATALIAELENTTLREAAHEHGAMLQRQSAFAAIGARAERAELDLKVALNRMLALKPTVEANDACAAAEAKLATANALIAEQAAQIVADGKKSDTDDALLLRVKVDNGMLAAAIKELRARVAELESEVRLDGDITNGL